MTARRWVAAVFAVVGVVGLAGWPWAALVAALLLAVAPSRRTSAAESPLSVVRGRVAALRAAAGRWATRRRVSAVGVPAGVVVLAVGLGWWLGPGVGVASGGLCLTGLALHIGWNV